MSVITYIACAMTGRSKIEQVERATLVCNALRCHGIIPISPVIEEKVEKTEGVLVNDTVSLREFWKRDKEILVSRSHVMLWDYAQIHSFGAIREYCLNRGVLWKPTVILVPEGTRTSVSEFEDDAVFFDVDSAAVYIMAMWGTRWKRWKWRLAMLNRTLLRWIYRQMMAWR
jgi:hypothetical protein